MISIEDYDILVGILGNAIKETGASVCNQAFELGEIKSSGDIYVGFTTSIPVTSTLASKAMLCIKEYNNEYGTNIELLSIKYEPNNKVVVMINVEK